MDVTLRLHRGIPDVPWARHEVVSALETADVPCDVDRVGLVVTELLTNALLHGREPVRVRAMVIEDHLRIEVHDSGEAVPTRRDAGPDDVTGRGLMLVAGLVERWGVDQSGDGKCVWAEFELTPHEPANVVGGAERFDLQLPGTRRSSTFQRINPSHGARSTA
jgi:anti-sigma regulatory factor (Ser/Thr protein kinase)